jgi:hypothetical protein
MTRSGITAKIGGLEDWKTGRLEDWKTGDLFFTTPHKMKEVRLVRPLNFPASAEAHPYSRPEIEVLFPGFRSCHRFSRMDSLQPC